MAGDNAIDIDRLTVDRGGVEILHGVSLHVRAGTVTGLMGPSGCGKTTMMRSIVGVQITRSGSLRVLDQPAGCRALRQTVAYTTQLPSVYVDLTVRENLQFFARVYAVGSDQIESALAAVDMSESEHRVVGTLSGGQRSRVSIATALLNDPQLLVLDEPTVGLDPVLRRDLWNTFHELARRGRTLLVSSHVMDEAERCDELILMRDGDVLVAGMTPRELLDTTGEHRLEDAFLALIERSVTPQPEVVS